MIPKKLLKRNSVRYLKLKNSVLCTSNNKAFQTYSKTLRFFYIFVSLAHFCFQFLMLSSLIILNKIKIYNKNRNPRKWIESCDEFKKSAFRLCASHLKMATQQTFSVDGHACSKRRKARMLSITSKKFRRRPINRLSITTNC